MESLQLNHWTEESTIMETSSLPSAYLIGSEEFPLFDNFAILPTTTEENDFLISNDTVFVAASDINTAKQPTKTAHDFLLELDQDIQNEPSWYADPKLDFVYEQLSPDEEAIQQETKQLLSEFDNVCNAFGVQFTPPATPPSSSSSSPVPEIPAEYVMGAPLVYMVALDNNSNDVIIDDVLSEASDESMELIDELVREHTTNLPDDTYTEMSDNVSVISSSSGSDASYSPSLTSDDASSCASFMSPRSSEGFAGFDEEWSPSVDKKRTLKKSSSAKAKSGEPKREKRPYGRPLHEKKARKKEQNKNAATRYRQKKKEQLKTVLSEEDELLEIHNGLSKQYEEVKRNINTMKDLLKEYFVAKGVHI